ncbi:MAG: type II toxin-antitoxin system HicB family antitoxin [Thermoleophilaceae bacterium]
MSEYVVIYERSETGWGAYCPDLPGLGVVGGTREEVERLIREGIAVHIESLREHGDPVPEPRTATGTVEAPAA